MNNAYFFSKWGISIYAALLPFLFSIETNTLPIESTEKVESPLLSPTLPVMTQAEILMDLYDATDGDNWTNNTNWGVGDPCGNSWWGVNCDGSGNVINLGLVNNQLNGTIPSSLSQLSNLLDLALSDNQLSGNIPSSLGDLDNIKSLTLANNSLDGGIPSELGSLTKLEQLRLDGNDLSGSIPPELGDASALRILYLSYNNLTGSIPTEISQLINLQVMILSSNPLTGPIPEEFENLTQIGFLSINSCELEGEIPSSLGNLSNLLSLSLSSNNLEGTIPSSLGNISTLESLKIGDNNLTGNIPPNIGNLQNLISLDLYQNQLTGKIPAFLGDLPNLNWIRLYQNQFTCYEEGLEQLCGRNVFTYGNPTYATWEDFCATGAGTCADIWAELECPDFNPGNWSEVQDVNYSGNAYLSTTVGENLPAPIDFDEALRYDVSIPTLGHYTLFWRAEGGSSHNSIWYFDGTNWVQSPDLSTTFGWQEVGSITLGQGVNSIYFAKREGVPIADKLYLSQKVESPEGEGEMANNCMATILGNINLSGCSSENIAIKMYEANTANEVMSTHATLDSDGNFTLQNILPSNYDIYLKMNKSLQKVQTETLTVGNNTISFGDLKMGDVNNDNLINFADFGLLAGSFNKNSGDPAFVPGADFNCDGLVNFADFGLLAGNFNENGEEP